jgi:hypothetical protein
MALRDAGLGLTAFYYFDFRNTVKQFKQDPFSYSSALGQILATKSFPVSIPPTIMDRGCLMIKRFSNA